MIAGALYALVYVMALAPGLPIGFALFGRRHAAGWVLGCALGYFFTSLAVWAVIAAGHPSAAWFVAAWGTAFAAAWTAVRPVRGPLLQVARWTRRDTTALLAALLLAAAIAIPPFARLGAADAQGNRYYRAYFTADFVWHMAVTAEIRKFAMPPRNMFMPHRPLHYYWGYFLVPGAASGAGIRPLADIETDLKVNAVGTAGLLTASIFMLAWLAVPRAWGAAAAVVLTMVASSAEGVVAIVRFANRGTPLTALRDLNIDAISNWWFAGLRVDGLPRCFWWVPQHSTAYILGLGALAIATAGGSAAPLAAQLIAGVALAGAIVFNPFVGGLFAVAWGIAVAVDSLRSMEPVKRLVRCAAAAVPAAAGLAWTQANRMTGGASGMLQFGLLGDARHAPLLNLLLSLGPALLPAVVGIAVAVADKRMRAIMPALLLLLIAIPVMHLVVLSGDPSWIGFRAGQLMLVAAPVLTGSGFAAASAAGRRIALSAAVLAFAAGVPTTAIDLYNAQDITNLAEGPGFPWTQIIDRDQRDALDFLRRATPALDTVQLDAVARGRTTWSIIPSFAERRQAAGIPRTLVDDPEYQERSNRVRTMYETTDARRAWEIARELRIDYVWIDAVERRAYPAGTPKFDTSPRFFVPAFRNAEVAIFRVQNP
ncbi:MAG TPA: hypothetical protein VEL51_17365 [Vicinamibacterales bacterium]|nr:hypothetical protein [Vicinamibacterales bacterium]